jgi:diguanylate cyclase (GGDEF)-like protein/putative nucleotidyltransferase with HDIG domain
MLPIFFLIVVFSYIESINTAKTILDKEINERISAETEIQKSYIEKSMNGARQISDDLTAIVGSTYRNETLSQYANIIESIIHKNSFILGAGIWFEPYVYDKSEKYVGPYVYKIKNDIATTYEYSNETYDYFSQDFYTRAKDKMQLIFTDIYFDKTSGLYMMTCSQPIKDIEGRFIGCISVDVELSSMKNLISDYNSTHEGKVYIINKTGIYLAAEDVELVKSNVNIIEASNDSFKPVVKQIISNKEGKTQFVKEEKKVNLYYDTLNDLGWKIVFEIDEDIIKSPIKEISKSFIVIFGLSLILLLASIYIIDIKNIDRPVKILLKEFEIIGNKLYEEEVNKKLKSRKDEFGLIGKTLQNMKEMLKKYQQELESSIEENINLNEELIQQNEELMQQNEELVESDLIISNSLQYSNSLIEAIPDTVFVISKDGIFLDCKGELEHLFFPKEYFIGKNIFEVMPPDIATAGLNLIKEVNSTGKTGEMEYEWETNGILEYHELRVIKWFEDKVIAIARNITDVHNYLKEIEYISYHDKVTGLYNRRYFDIKVQELSCEDNYPICIIFSDINGLKLVNDSFGHGQGDYILQKYASILNASRRGDELICRIGGDEFAIVLTATDLQKTEEYINKLTNKFSDVIINGMELSVSFGYEMIQGDNQSIQSALKKAEDMMYQNKLYEASSRRSKTIEIILSTLHEKNPREEKHSRRVAELCEIMAVKMGMISDEVKKIRTAGILHDIGKIAIQEELLNKPGVLTHEEYIEICKHTEIGYRILNTVPNMSEVSEVVLAHHERWDGNGYPRGLKGEEIPLYARIISIIDTYDAMTSDRSYRKGMSNEKAVKELIKNAGTQFDPELTQFFMKNVVEFT